MRRKALPLVLLTLAIVVLSVSCNKKENEVQKQIERRSELESEWYEENRNDYLDNIDYSDFDV